MEKSSSFYDWEHQFRKNNKREIKKSKEKYSVNSLGISDSNFKNFIKKWKEENIE